MKYLNQIATLSLIFTVSNNTVLATNSRAFTEYLGGVSNLISKFVQNTAIPTKPEDWMHYNPLSNLTDLLTTIINFNLDSINISSIEKNKIEKCKSYLKYIKQYIDQKPIRNSNKKSFQEK